MENIMNTQIISAKKDNDKQIYSAMFEVFGHVQGVNFRKFTLEKAKTLELNGWCRRTQDGTVKGILEGPEEHISEMKAWLEQKGSPRSTIEKAVFTSFEPIEAYTFSAFAIR